MLKRRNKKKGFTLIELVIVLAVIGIISLIAIPNFTKVLNDSNKKADNLNKEQIEKIVTMELAQGNININSFPINRDIEADLEIQIRNKDNEKLILLKGTNINMNYKELVEAFSNLEILKKDSRIIGYKVNFLTNGNIKVLDLKK